MSSDPEYYVNTPQIPGLSNPGIKSKGGGDKSHIFAQLYTEAKACVKAGDSCTVEQMNNILDKYVDVDSFVGAMVCGCCTACVCACSQILVRYHSRT